MKKALTQSQVNSLDRATTLRDPSLKGFAVRVYPSLKKSYGLIRKSASGKETFDTLLEPFRDATKVPIGKARSEARQLLLEETGGGGNQFEKNRARLRREAEEAENRTFGKVLELWWAETADSRPQTTSTAYRVQIDTRILPALGDKLLVDVRTSDIVRLRDTHKRKPASANMSVSICSKVFDFAAERDWVSASPAYRIKPLKEKGHQVHLTETDIKRLFEAISKATFRNGSPNPARLPLMLAAITGCRIGEAETITPDEIRHDDQGRCGWFLSAERTKQKRAHINWLVTPDHQMIAVQAASIWDASVTKAQRRHRTKALFDQIVRNLKLPRCGAHVFRRASITEQLRNELPQLVQKSHGHANLATTMGYENKVSDETFAATVRQAKRRGI